MSTTSEKTSTTEKEEIFEVPDHVREKAYINSPEAYQKMYERSVSDMEGFWSEVALEFINWDRQWESVFEWEDKENARFSWFKGGKLNASVNCLDRHLEAGRADKVALYWEGDDPSVSRTFTFGELHREVNRFANVLRKKGVEKGDRVAIYLPMVPELLVSMLACARVGAIHSVVFGGFSADALRDRVEDTEARLLITADGGLRGQKQVSIKEKADDAVSGLSFVKNVIVVNRTGREVHMQDGRDEWWNELVFAPDITDYCEPESMDAEDPLFILYTSGSTGKPKGVLHTTGGYLVFVSASHKWVFDVKEEDVFWCTADIGWITGHSYIVYGPLANGTTTLMFEGVPTYPDPGRFWDIVDKYKVNQLYTAPTAIRALMREGDKWVENHDLGSLRILGSVGEPINPEAWRWYHQKIGKGRCPVVDTYWQTETGGFLITPLPGAIPTKPGSACKPFFGIRPAILREDGSKAETRESGHLVIETPWPGCMRTVYKNHQRFVENYWAKFPGKYTTGDGAYVDDDGYYRIVGRLDDVINISGHRLGTAEVESALDSHPAVAEAAVVGTPHDLKGQGIYAFVTLKNNMEPDENLMKELVEQVRKQIGPIATPDKIQFSTVLPKTRSGKIMRRILEKIATGMYQDLGDTSTLADPNAVQILIEGAKESS
ncbi:MAG: acetate--CoA ligase [bacterium]